MKDRLIELLRQPTYIKEGDVIIGEKRLSWKDAESLAEHLLANGVIIPPCKVGDKIYQLDTAGNIYESEITKIIYDTNGIAFDSKAIGKCVFLSREAAEQALKGGVQE